LANQVDFPHAGDVFEAALDLLLDQSRQVLGREDIRTYGERDDGYRREIKFLNDRLFNPLGQIPSDGVDLRPCLLGGLIDFDL